MCTRVFPETAPYLLLEEKPWELVSKKLSNYKNHNWDLVSWSHTLSYTEEGLIQGLRAYEPDGTFITALLQLKLDNPILFSGRGTRWFLLKINVIYQQIGNGPNQ